MGESTKNRKRKFKGGTEATKEKDTAIMDTIDESEATTVKPKKAKKNKSTHINVENNNDISESIPKKTKEANITNKAVSESELTKPKKKKDKNKVSVSGDELNQNDRIVAKKQKKKKKKLVETSNTSIGELSEDILAQYPVLKDEELIQRFMAVGINNNQKGRIRQHFKNKVSGTSKAMQPEVINNLIKAILHQENPDLKQIRILHNMLKQALLGKTFVKKGKTEKPQPIKNAKKEDSNKEENETEEKKQEQKVKGPKRYVVFIGNLPLDISKEKILEHFSDLGSNIKDVRIPKQGENKKSAIAYLEVADEVSYELALSKHHSMLDNRRINVLYSTQQNSKISKTEAKGKAAKLVALQKSGQLAGSVPLNKKRSARRKKMKLAQKQAQAAERGA